MSWGNLNWLDYVLLAILFLSTLFAARKGPAREVIGLATAFFAIVLAMWFYGTAGSLIAPYAGSPRVANLLGFLLVVLAVFICGSIVGRVVRGFLKTVGLSFFDRLLGAVFGLVRGVLIAVALLTAYLSFGPNVDSKTAPAAVVHSQIAPYVLTASRAFVAMAPMSLKASFTSQYTEVLAAIRQNVEGKNVEGNKDEGLSGDRSGNRK